MGYTNITYRFLYFHFFRFQRGSKLTFQRFFVIFGDFLQNRKITLLSHFSQKITYRSINPHSWSMIWAIQTLFTDFRYFHFLGLYGGSKFTFQRFLTNFGHFPSVFEKNKKRRRAESRALGIPKIVIDNLWGSVSKRYLQN